MLDAPRPLPGLERGVQRRGAVLRIGTEVVYGGWLGGMEQLVPEGPERGAVVYCGLGSGWVRVWRDDVLLDVL